MTEKEIKEIYDRLLELTKAEKIHWKQSGEGEYSLSFSRSSILIEKEYNYEGAPITLKIYNQEGLLIAYASSIEIDEAEAVKVYIFDPAELFDLVQERVYRHSETSQNILDELRKLELSQTSK